MDKAEYIRRYYSNMSDTSKQNSFEKSAWRHLTLVIFTENSYPGLAGLTSWQVWQGLAGLHGTVGGDTTIFGSNSAASGGAAPSYLKFRQNTIF